MAEFDKTNRGSIWRNEKKEKDTHPDFTGSLNVDGVEYWVSAWKRKEGAHAKAPALSFSIKPKEEQKDNRSASMMTSDEIKERRAAEMDDDIPF